MYFMVVYSGTVTTVLEFSFMIGFHKPCSSGSKALMRASGHSWHRGCVNPEDSASSLSWPNLCWSGNYLHSLQTRRSDSQPVMLRIKLMEPLLFSDAPDCLNPCGICSGGHMHTGQLARGQEKNKVHVVESSFLPSWIIITQGLSSSSIEHEQPN